MGFIFTTDEPSDELTAAQNIVSQLKELNQFKKDDDFECIILIEPNLGNASVKEPDIIMICKFEKPMSFSFQPPLEHSFNDKEQDKIELQEVTDNSAVSIQLGYGLIKLVDQDNTGPLVSRVTGVRRQVSKELGFVFPSVRITDDLSLGANEYTIKIGQTIIGQNQIFPDKLLAIPGDTSDVKLSGIDVKDPSFNMDATWIEKFHRDKAENAGYMIVTPEAVVATHLNQILIKHAGDLIGQDEVQELLDNLQKTCPKLVDTVIPKIIPLNQLTGVLKILLTESVPI